MRPRANAPLSEQQILAEFLDTSADLKTLRAISLNNRNDSGLGPFIAEIEASKNFGDLLNILDRFDFYNSTDPSIKYIHPNVMKSIFYVSSFFNQNANAAYYATHLLENAKNVMAEHGFKYEAAKVTYHS